MDTELGREEHNLGTGPSEVVSPVEMEGGGDVDPQAKDQGKEEETGAQQRQGEEGGVQSEQRSVCQGQGVLFRLGSL